MQPKFYSYLFWASLVVSYLPFAIVMATYFGSEYAILGLFIQLLAIVLEGWGFWGTFIKNKS